MNRVILLTLLAGTVLPQQAEETEFARKRIRAKMLVQQYVEGKKENRGAILSEIAQLGEAGIAELEEALRARGGYEIYQAVNFIRLKMDIESSEFKPVVPFSTDADTNKYLTAKFKEAVLKYSQGRIYDCQKMCEAVLTLEPNCDFREQFMKLKQKCEYEVVDRSVVALRIAGGHAFKEISGITARLSFTNVSGEAITITFGKGASVLVTVEATADCMLGEEVKSSRVTTVEIPESIELRAGEAKEIPFTIETHNEFPDANLKDVIRFYKVSAAAYPLQVKVGDVPKKPKLIFKPTEFVVVPEKYEKFLASPAASFGEAFESGTLYDVFVALSLLQGDEQRVAARQVIEMMKKAPAGDNRKAIEQVLRRISGGKTFGGDPAKWEQWLNEKR